MNGGVNGKRENGAPREKAAATYLSLVKIENIRSIASLCWEVAPGPGWNVVLGDNGAGKSTFLRAIAWALMDREERWSLPVEVLGWVRSGCPEGHLEIHATTANVGAEQPIVVHETLTTGAGTAWGWDPRLKHAFSAGFGPFRRFTGGDAEYEKQYAALPRAVRHLSLFSERASLTETLSWLKLLRFKELEQDTASAALLHALTSFVNQDGFLPNSAHLDRITSDNVLFIDGNGAEVPLDELSDGYRSILSLTFELIRQLAAHYGAERVFDTSGTTVVAPGIVLIDEVDAHLHPSWQRRIGLFLRRCFPNIQFVVTTHSPLVCQAAEVGTVFRLARPGTAEEGRLVTGAELDRLLYGDLVEAYETEAMGGIHRSEKAQAMLGELSTLNRQELDQGLTDDERARQRRLRAIFSAEPEARS